MHPPVAHSERALAPQAPRRIAGVRPGVVQTPDRPIPPAPTSPYGQAPFTVKSLPLPAQFLVLALAGRLNQHQQDAVDGLRRGNRVLREMFARGRLRLTLRQGRRLAICRQALERALLACVESLVSPGTMQAG